VTALSATDLRVAFELLGDVPNGERSAFTISFVRRLGSLLRADVEAGYTEFDPTTGGVIAHVDDRHGETAASEDELFVELLRGGHHPLFEARRRGRHDALKLSDFLSRRSLHQGRLYNEWLREDGVEDMLACVLDFGPLGRGSLYFGRTRRFTERERSLLELLRPQLVRHVDEARLRVRAQLAVAALESSEECLLLTQGDRIELGTPSGIELLEEWFPGHRSRLPAELVRWLTAGASAERGGSVARPAEPFRLERQGRVLVIETPAEGVLLLRERHSSPVDALTRRELEVVRCVETGASNREIASTLGLSEGTVRTHLSKVFAKLGVRTRTAAVASVRRAHDDA
jgi:DNA-binding CsgD family transcriptional regulator